MNAEETSWGSSTLFWGQNAWLWRVPSAEASISYPLFIQVPENLIRRVASKPISPSPEATMVVKFIRQFVY